MQFGICLPIADAGIAHAAGFDFIEPAVRSLSPLDPDFAAIRAPFDNAPLPTPVFNVFVPAEIRLTGADVAWKRVEGYLDAAIGRVAALGGQTIVFGSGGARNVADGFPQEEAHDQLARFLRLAGGIAEDNGVTIVIEPLNSRDSNIVTSVVAGMQLAQAADHPRVRLLADLYHMLEDDEPLENITTCAQWIEHIHVAGAQRAVPGEDGSPYQEFFRRLHACGYSGRISIECRWDDLAAQAGPAGTFLRRAWDETQWDETQLNETQLNETQWDET